MSKKNKWLGGTKRLKSIAATLGIFPLASDTMPQPAAGATNLNHTAENSGRSRKPQSGRRVFVKRGQARYFPSGARCHAATSGRRPNLYNPPHDFSLTTFSSTAWRRAVIAACVAAGFSLVASNALADDVNVPINGDLAANPSTTPPAGTNWLLQGDAAINSPVTVPTQASVADALTFTGASGGSTINMGNPALGVNPVFSASSGSGIWINTAGTVIFDGEGVNRAVLQGSFIYNGNGSGNGDIYLGTTGGDVTVQDMTTAMGSANVANGGAIHSLHGNIYIGDETSTVSLLRNQTTGVGGAIFTPGASADPTNQNGKITIHGSVITINSNNAQINSGAISTGKQGADITIGNADGSTQSIEVSNNSAEGSGGAMQAANGAVTLNGENITVSANQARNWEDLNLTSGAGTGSGGAILSGRATTIGNPNSIVTITNNTAVGLGGAIATSDPNFGDVAISGSAITMTGNKAGNLTGTGPADPLRPGNYSAGSLGGGAIYSSRDIELNGGAITMTGNQAINGTGGALKADRNIAISGGMLAQNNTALGTATLDQGRRNGDGGAIWAGGNVTMNGQGGDIEFLSNQARLDGGAIWAGGDVTMNGQGGAILFQNNTTTGTGGSGGAIWAGGDVMMNGQGGNILFQNNTTGTGGSGGAIWAGGDVTMNGQGGDIKFLTNQVRLDGGAIRAGGDVTLNSQGGDILFQGNTITIAPGTSGSGGAIWAGGNVTLNGQGGDIEFLSNQARINGGAIWAGGNVTLNGQGGDIVFQNNTTTGTGGSGGAIRAEGNVTLNAQGGDILFQDNTAGINGSGGAIYSTLGNIYIGNETSTVSFIGNQSSTVGGAIYTPSETSANNQNGKVTIRGGVITINGNTCTTASSGAIYTGKQDADITIGNADGSTQSIEVNGNTAGGSGGAMQAAKGAVTLNGENITLSDNQARNWNISGAARGTGSGGAILSGRATTIGNPNSIVTITNNSAVGNGGAIATSDANLGDVAISGSAITITGNKAGNPIGTGTGPNDPANYNAGYLGGGAIYSSRDIALNGGAITMSGNQAVNGSGGALEAQRNITISGSMLAKNNTALGTVTLRFGRNGDGGAIWVGGDVTLNAQGGDIKFLGNQAAQDGGAIWAGGGVTLNAQSGDILFQGNSAGGEGNAIWFENSSNAATFNAAAGRTITFYDPIASNDAGGLLTVNKTGPGAVIFDGEAASSPIYAMTTVQEGAFVARNGAEYGADLGGDTSFTVNPGATLAGGGEASVNADNFTLGGQLDVSGSSLNLPGHPATGSASGGFSTFTVNSGNVNFAPGSQILFNADLNNGGTQLTDKLVLDLNGSAITGAAEVVITAIGHGAVTHGDGIELVEIENGTGAGAFSLAHGYVGAGPYEYTLRLGGVGDDVADGNWYLRSSLDCSLPRNRAVCGGGTPPGPGEEPGTGRESGTGQEALPYYRPETSVDTALPSMALLYGYGLLNTLHERVGEEEDIRGRKDLNTWAPKTGAWGRVFDTHGTQYGGTTGIYGPDGPKYDYDFFGIQVGQDVFRKEHDGGSRDHGGLYFAYGHADNDVMHFDGTRGRDQFGAYSLGAYWTHFGQSGWYTDAIIQGTYYDTTSSTPESPDMTTHGSGFAASLEAGKPFRFSQGYFIEPQAQVTYQIINFADANIDSGNTQVSFSDVDSLTGRIGARLGHDWALKRGRQLTAWLRPSLWREFRGNPTTAFSSDDGPVPFRANLEGTWGEMNLGISGQANDLSSTFCATSLYANASYDRSFEGEGYAWTGKVGIRFSW